MGSCWGKQEGKIRLCFLILNTDSSREGAVSLKINDSTAVRSYGHSFI